MGLQEDSAECYLERTWETGGPRVGSGVEFVTRTTFS